MTMPQITKSMIGWKKKNKNHYWAYLWHLSKFLWPFLHNDDTNFKFEALVTISFRENHVSQVKGLFAALYNVTNMNNRKTLL